MGSGPFYKRVATFNLEKCSKNWWRNLLFINNYSIGAVDICGGHTFWSSVDFQLFVFGLAAIYVFNRSVKAGFIVIAVSSTLANVKILYNSYVFETTPNLFIPFPISVKIPEYLGYIHMQTAVYMPAYFTGFLLSYAMSHHDLIKRLQLNSLTAHAKFFLLTQLVFLLININTSLVNVFDAVPAWFKPSIVVINRNTQTIAFSLMILQCLALKPFYNKFWGIREEQPLQESGETTGEAADVSQQQQPPQSFNPLRAFCRLTYPLYVSNYLVIRSEFFNRRFLESSELFWMLKRSASTLMMLYIVAFAYQICFLSPLDAVRRYLISTGKPNDQERAKGG